MQVSTANHCSPHLLGSSAYQNYFIDAPLNPRSEQLSPYQTMASASPVELEKVQQFLQVASASVEQALAFIRVAVPTPWPPVVC
jgi:hypothetical protein